MSDEHSTTSVDDDQATRTPVAITTAKLTDPHMQEATRYPKRIEDLIAVTFVLAMIFFALFGAAYWQNLNPWILGGTFGAGMLLLGFGLTAWGKYLMPQGPFVEERHTLAGTAEERDAMSAALVERSAVVVKRRKMLGGLFATGAGIFTVVLMFPLIRSLGPLPGTSLQTTNWKKGTRLVDSSGRTVTEDTLVPGGLMTVFPEGLQNTDEGQAEDQVVLIRIYADQDVVTMPGRETWGPKGYVAYSKLCTHLGCPVGLYEQELQLLVCPCHQSMFDVTNGAVPQFGPAPRPLPQLALEFKGGVLVAQKPFNQAVGPGFWERTTRSL